jgi:hypothetical protein
MWFVFGFITFTGFFLYQIYSRLNASWKGTKAVVASISYQFKILTHKNKTTGLKVGIKGNEGYDYKLKKESTFDAICKSFGLAKEHQTGNKAFDDLVYVVSDNASLHRQISSNQSIIDSTLALFSVGKKFSCDVKEIRNNSDRIWVEFSVPSDIEDDVLKQLSNQAAPLLNKIVKQLTAYPQSAIKWQDPYVLKAAILLAISSAFAINGFVHLMRLDWVEVPFTVDSTALFYDAILWGGVIIIALLALTFTLLGRSSRTHIVMFELIVFGLFGTVSTTFAELRDINIELDESNGFRHEVKLLDKTSSRSRNSTSYYLYVNDWNNEEVRKKIEVDSELYSSVMRGNKLIVEQYDGYLNYRWVKSLYKKN